MNIPSMPIDKFLDDKGEMSEIWYAFFQQLLQLMQQNLSNEGIIIPQQPTTNIVLLTDPSKTPNGTVIYDSTTDNFKGRQGGVFKIFTLT